MVFFIVFVCILAVLFLVINFLFAPHNPYQEKYSIFECGFHSFLGQNRSNFYISFFVYGLLYLIFDLEIVLIYPYSVSAYVNSTYGLIIMCLFTLILTLGFTFEIGKDALIINHRQNYNLFKTNSKYISISLLGGTQTAELNPKSKKFGYNTSKREYSTFTK